MWPSSSSPSLEVPFLCFHDRDLAPEADTFAESCVTASMADTAAKHMERTGVRLLWGTANLFAHPRYAAGAATNPDPDVFAHAAAQVRHCLNITHRLGGANYVLWEGLEGYETCSTPTCPENSTNWDVSCTWPSSTNSASGSMGRSCSSRSLQAHKAPVRLRRCCRLGVPSALRSHRRRARQHGGQARHVVRARLHARGRLRGHDGHPRLGRRQHRRRPSPVGRGPPLPRRSLRTRWLCIPSYGPAGSLPVGLTSTPSCAGSRSIVSTFSTRISLGWTRPPVR